MLRKFFATALAAFVVTAAPVAVSAGDCGAPSSCSPCADVCSYPKVRYRTEYHNVVENRTKTCYQTVQKTIMKECRQVVCKPVYEEKIVEQQKVVCKPVYEEKIVEQQRIVCKPVMETKQITVCTGEWRNEQHFVQGACVTRKCRLPDTCCFDPCSCKSHRVKGQTVCYQEQLPGHYVCKKVWVPRQEVRNVQVCRNVQETVVEKVPVKTCRMVQETVVEKVPVKTCRMVQEVVIRQVPVTVCEKVPVCTTEQVCRRVKVRVPVCENECRRPSLFSGLFHKRDNCCAPAAPCCGTTYGAAYGPAMNAPATGAGAEKMPTPKEK